MAPEYFVKESRVLLTIALPKGKLEELSLSLLEKIGVSVKKERGRQLIFQDDDQTFRFLTVRATDVPVYVEHGAADLGVVGQDILTEQEPDVYQPLDLRFGYCRLVVAEPKERTITPGSLLRVATKFPRTAEKHFQGKGQSVEIIKLYGSIELAPLVGLSDQIVDLVSSGRTLLENGLVEVETILTSTARLIINRASMKTRYHEIKPLLRQLTDIDRGEVASA